MVSQSCRDQIIGNCPELTLAEVFAPKQRFPTHSRVETIFATSASDREASPQAAMCL